MSESIVWATVSRMGSKCKCLCHRGRGFSMGNGHFDAYFLPLVCITMWNCSSAGPESEFIPCCKISILTAIQSTLALISEGRAVHPDVCV